jgi:hypothetical protein
VKRGIATPSTLNPYSRLKAFDGEKLPFLKGAEVFLWKNDA